MRPASPTTVFVVVETFRDENDVTIHLEFAAAIRHIRRAVLLDRLFDGKNESEATNQAALFVESITKQVESAAKDWGTVWSAVDDLKVELHRASVRLPGPVVPTGDLWVMLMCTVRYAMGRSSYLVGLVSELVRVFRPWLRPEEVKQLRDEVVREIDVAEKFGHRLGQEVDHQTWRQLAEELNSGRVEPGG